MTGALELGGGAAALAAGLLLLRAAWRARPGDQSLPTIGGWSLIAVGLGFWSLGSGLDLAMARFALAFSLAAFGVLAASADIRTRRARRGVVRERPEAPGHQSGVHGRTAARIVLAGPLSVGFGLAVCVALAARAPLTEVNAVILAGLAAPIAMAAAMAWSLMDRRPSRAAIGLGAAILALLAACRL